MANQTRQHSETFYLYMDHAAHQEYMAGRAARKHMKQTQQLMQQIHEDYVIKEKILKPFKSLWSILTRAIHKVL